MNSGNRHKASLSEFYAFLDARYDHHYEPKRYSLHLRSALRAVYRVRFRRIPAQRLFHAFRLPERQADFAFLSELGSELVTAICSRISGSRLAKYHGKGDHAWRPFRYSEAEEAVWINKDPVLQAGTEAVWNFHIGGYRCWRST